MEDYCRPIRPKTLAVCLVYALVQGPLDHSPTAHQPIPYGCGPHMCYGSTTVDLIGKSEQHGEKLCELDQWDVINHQKPDLRDGKGSRYFLQSPLEAESDQQQAAANLEAELRLKVQNYIERLKSCKGVRA